MYFLTEEERKQVTRGLLPKARAAGVDDELRGWNWHQPPLTPAYDIRLALYEVANSYCPTGRDLYLRRVLGIRSTPNKAMLRGKIMHAALAHVLVSTKRLIYSLGPQHYQQILGELAHLEPSSLRDYENLLSGEELADLRRKVEILTSFECARLASRIEEALVRQPYIEEDSLVAEAIPVVVERKLDGSFLGLSPNLSTDALTFAEPMVVDIKFGAPADFHRLTTTGYALVLEALYDFPVDIGCIVYGEFKGDRLLVRKDLHLISDELRQWFIEQRDEKMRMIYEEHDPGLPEQCFPTCQYYGTCRGEQ